MNYEAHEETVGKPPRRFYTWSIFGWLEEGVGLGDTGAQENEVLSAAEGNPNPGKLLRMPAEERSACALSSGPERNESHEASLTTIYIVSATK